MKDSMSEELRVLTVGLNPSKKKKVASKHTPSQREEKKQD